MEQPLLSRLTSTLRRYPRQFWYQIMGMLLSTTGMGMIWPFLTIYMRQKLGVPLTTVAALLALDSTFSIVSSFVAGPVADRFGRKWVMVLSLTCMGLIYMTMSAAGSLGFFAVLMALRGAVVPLYRIGADAMIADMIPEDQRVEAYSISRMVTNVGVALGPSAGGFVAASSYTAAFFIAALSLFIFSVFVALVMHETMPARAPAPVESKPAGAKRPGVVSRIMGSYLHVLHNGRFLAVVLGYTLVGMGSTLVFVLLTTYAKENFGLAENQTGFVMAVNAVMVVSLQYIVTHFTRRYPPLRMMALAALLYAVGIGSNALGSSLVHFALSMVVMTLGELILMPTSTSYAANLAPADMRARYMSIYWLGWGISHGFSPVVGGLLNDNVAPVAIWYGGLVWGLLAFLVFFSMALKDRKREKAMSQAV